MHLDYVHQVLRAVAEEEDGSLRFRTTAETDHEVRLMAEAGLVDATLSDGTVGSFTTIHRLTDLGRTFLRAFKHDPVIIRSLLSYLPPPPAVEDDSDYEPDVLKKWNANFALNLHPPTEPPRVR
jgi:hypothetical protein